MTSTARLTAVAESLRILLLPISDAHYRAACLDVLAVLDGGGYALDDPRDVIRALYDEWRDGGAPRATLVEIVGAALRAEPELSPRFRSGYFELHANLVTRHLLSFEGARGLLSHALHILYLLRVQHASCAQIANIFSARQGGGTYVWGQVQEVARALGTVPALDRDNAEALTDEDVELEIYRFADASPTESIEILDSRAAELGFPDSLGTHLRDFYDPDSAPPYFEPAYAIILHANALASEFYDHPPQEAAYEFKPRGGVVQWLQSSYHPSYHAAESAYLNNSKGAYAFDENWAWGRDSSKWRRAHALSRILRSLGAMPYAGRRELAGWIRQWLLRVERAAAELEVSVIPPTAQAVSAFLDNAALANTQTSGVLDQRVVDYAAALWLRENPGWVAKGIGDHVNASNTSSSKLGDIELLNTGALRAQAIEAHGGRLSDLYVEGHAASLRRSLAARRVELEAAGPAADWSIEVVFVAHELAVAPRPSESISGFDVSWTFLSYEDYLAHARAEHVTAPERSLAVFTDTVVTPISRSYVPPRIRERFNLLSAMSSR